MVRESENTFERPRKVAGVTPLHSCVTVVGLDDIPDYSTSGARRHGPLICDIGDVGKVPLDKLTDPL